MQAQEITEQIVCERCGEAEEIISLGLCITCLELRDQAIQDNAFDEARKGY
jgi:hypothetical protein